jgi:hypothetical protein
VVYLWTRRGRRRLHAEEFADHVTEWILVGADVVLVEDGSLVVIAIHYRSK